MSRSRVTLADVAKLAGLSTSAASMILNGRTNTRLSKEAHARVQAAAIELGYRPNVAARGLRTDTTHTIGFISDLVATTRFASGLIEGALHASEEAGHVMLVLETGGNPRREQKAIDEVLDRQVDGIVFATMRARELFVPALPPETAVVMLNATNPHHQRTVLPHEFDGGREVVRYLLAHGFSDDIALIGHNEAAEKDYFRSATVEQRISGIRSAMHEADLAFAAELSVWEWEPQHGYTLTKELLKRQVRPRALLCMNDRLAFGAYQALAEEGLRVPDDISVVGFDNDEIASYLRPGLTTLALPHEHMGRRAVEALLSGSDSTTVDLIPMPLVERRSVRRGAD